MSVSLAQRESGLELPTGVTDAPGCEGGLRLPTPRHPLIFESSWGGTLTQKATTLGVGALFLAVWLSLWVPLLTLCFWLVLPGWGYETVVSNQEDSFPVIILVSAAGVALAGMLILVGTWEWAKGRPAEEMVATPNVAASELAQAHGLEEAVLVSAWGQRRLVVHHDEHGQVVRVDASEPRTTVLAPDLAPIARRRQLGSGLRAGAQVRRTSATTNRGRYGCRRG